MKEDRHKRNFWRLRCTAIFRITKVTEENPKKISGNERHKRNQSRQWVPTKLR